MNVLAPSPVISVRNVSFRYPKGRAVVLDDIDMTVRKGEVLAILGASGSGKSTLLDLIAGLKVPQTGTITCNGYPVLEPSPTRVLMFQDPALFPWMTVLENVAIGLRFAGQEKGERLRRSREILRATGIADLADVNTQRLSGGQKQRVALARSLAPDPGVLLLDEPFSSLDPVSRDSLRDEVRTIVKRFGKTAVLVTHDLDEALIMADRILVLTSDPGQIAGCVLPNLDANATQSRTQKYHTARDELLSLFDCVSNDGTEENGVTAARHGVDRNFVAEACCADRKGQRSHD